MRALERAAAARAASVSAELARRVEEAVPGARAEMVPEGVRVVGRGLARRLLVSAALRWPAGLFR